MGYFIIYFSRSTFQMIKIYVLTYLYSLRNYYDIFAFVITNGAMISWIGYGAYLYYSDQNNCDKI